MSTDAELHDILREHEGDLLAFARKAYEHGLPAGARVPAFGSRVRASPSDCA